MAARDIRHGEGPGWVRGEKWGRGQLRGSLSLSLWPLRQSEASESERESDEEEREDVRLSGGTG